MARRNRKSRDKALFLNQYYWFTPRFWEGMRTRTYGRLLLRNRLAISPSRWASLFLGMPLPCMHSVCYRWQEFRWRREIDRAGSTPTPLFILGHWRSGTTLLHELMALDPLVTTPSTHDCFSPNDFLSTGPFVRRWLHFVLPNRRPMDNMAAGWDRPQEDEFALMNMGLPSIYENLAFPNHGWHHAESLDGATLSEDEARQWKEGLLWFLRRIHVKDARRAVLKSPPHLGRIDRLLELFPDAKFVHIVRDPCHVYASTVRLWKALCETQSYQVPTYEGLDEFVLSAFAILYGAFERQRAAIDPKHIVEVRFEELIADPVEQVGKIYDQLALNGFERVRRKVENHMAAVGPYRRNRHRLSAETRQAIIRRWSTYYEKYGYVVDG